MKNKNIPGSPFKHPLTDVALSAFAEQPCQDITTMSNFLSGATYVSGSRQKLKANEAYKIVAEDVLSCMEDKGIIKKDEEGCFRLAS